jgi:hypothetical protein
MTIIYRIYRTIFVIVILIAFAFIITNTSITPAFAIKKFYNCMTGLSNKSGKLTIEDVTMCYDKEYHTGPYYTRNHSTGGIGK